MLKRWHLSNFKSFQSLPSLDFAYVNVLAGANSSGKSSIIQSILLLKQTLQYGSTNRPITLNGPLLRLGGFDDVRNFESPSEDLKVGFDFEFNELRAQGSGRSQWLRSFTRRAVRGDLETPQTLSVNLSYGEKKEGKKIPEIRGAKSLTPELNETSLSIKRISRDKEIIEDYYINFKRKTSEQGDDEEFYYILKYDVELDKHTQAEILSEKPNANIEGGTITYFMPHYVAVRFNAAEQRARDLVDSLCDQTDTILPSPDLTDELVSYRVIEFINEWLRHQKGSEPSPQIVAPATELEVREQILPYVARTNRLLGGLFGDTDDQNQNHAAQVAALREGLLQIILRETEPEYEMHLEHPRAGTDSLEFVSEYFKSGVRYLGPLRDNPRPVYQLEALESTTDVGYRGEHTAAVLDINSTRSVTYHKPPVEGLRDDYLDVSRPKRATLHDAVVDWLTYLGVAEEVVTTDAGVFGNLLQVSTDETGKLHDLTNVGVGVSQVLPIVVTSLLAQKGSLLIFEQPELHLHPKVQARLADFFLSLALDGKQTLLETHSEYLVDRFRLRIALSSKDEVRPLINILFTQKTDSRSTLTPVEINEFGSIVNWPRDFFEQSQHEVSRIIQAASRKRKSKK
jgi:predicted ATPase